MGESLTFSTISTLEIHHNGEYLAVGYDNGSIAVLKILQPSSSSSSSSLSPSNNSNNHTNNNSNNTHNNSNSNSHNNNKHNKLVGNKRKTIEQESTTIGNDNDDNQFTMDLDEPHYTTNGRNSNSSSLASSLGSSNGSSNSNSNNNQDIIRINIDDNKSYKVLCFYQAHDSEVIQIKWCKNHSAALLFLSTSVSSIKLWRFQLLQNQYNSNITIEKPTLISNLKKNNNNINSSGSNIYNNNNNNNDQYRIKFDLKRTFEHEEIFNINSISLNSDGNTFLSSDELRVYLWDLNQNQECYNIIDLKPTSMQLLNEVIRVTKFHPIHCNLLMYGSSRGSLKLCDMRESALVHNHSRCYDPLEVNQSTFADYLNSIFDMSFSLDGRYIVSRNLQSLSIWDMNMDNRPLAIYNLYNQSLLNQKLYDFHESSSFVNKFQCNFINQNQVITGSYDNKCLVWNPFNSESFILESNLQYDPIELVGLKNRIENIHQQPPPTTTLTREQVMSYFNRIYYHSNFYNIQLSTLSKLNNINNINNNINNNNNNIFNNNNNNNDNNINSHDSKLTINDYSNIIGSISTSYNNNGTLSLAISSSDHLFLYR